MLSLETKPVLLITTERYLYTETKFEEVDIESGSSWSLWEAGENCHVGERNRSKNRGERGVGGKQTTVRAAVK